MHGNLKAHFGFIKRGRYLHLRFRHAEGVRQLGPLRPGQVLGLLEGLLQGEDLLAREGGAGVLLLAVLVQLLAVKI